MGGRSGTVRPRFTMITGPRNTDTKYIHRVLIGIPTLGTVRIEWHNAMNGIVIPTNFSNSMQTPIGFSTSDAQNMLVKATLELGFEWLLLIEDDVIVPCDILLKLRPYMRSAKYPLLSGLYYVKGNRKEPMIYRGRGSGPFLDWKPGSRVMCDGVPTGCTLIHSKLLAAIWEESETYRLRANQTIAETRKVFESPRFVSQDVNGGYRKLVGTSDLYFCDRVMKEGLLAKAGWPGLQKKRYPYLVDTSIACGHIDRGSGAIF